MAEHWGTRLQHALGNRGVRKLHALAVEIGVDQSAISRWRKGQPISLLNAIALSVALDVSLDWLLMGRGAMDAHRNASYDPVDDAAQTFFGKLNRREATTLHSVFLALSNVAGRRAQASDR